MEAKHWNLKHCGGGLCLPNRFFANFEQSRSSHRPVITGTTGMVVSGHHLATQTGVRILEKGGNAIDAGVAAGICLGGLQLDLKEYRRNWARLIQKIYEVDPPDARGK
jgi:hypothetical protein